MKCILALSAALLLASSAGAAAEEPHPVAKVIRMLQGLQAKAEAEGKSEALLFEKFEYWCRNSKKTLNKAITEEKEQISMLETQIEAKTKQEATLEKEIARLTDQIGGLNTAGLEADGARKEENDVYVETSTDLNTTIDALHEAIRTLEGASSPEAVAMLLAEPRIRGTLALVQAVASEAQRGQIAALLLQQPANVSRPKLFAEGDYEAHIKEYSFKSYGVVEMLKQLRDKFEAKLLETVKGETNAMNSYELAKQARDNLIQVKEASRTEKSTILGGVKRDITQLTSELQDTQADLVADTDTLGETDKACNLKKQEWEDRSAVRARELEAMKMAVTILSKATGVRTDAPKNPVPPPSPLEASESGPSFLQVEEDPRTKAASLLRAAARVVHSKALDRLVAQLLASPEEPFGEVINMIQKMIFRLMDEQKDEDEHKLWCDKELSTSNTSKSDKEDKIAELNAKLRKGTATVQKLTMDIEAAQQMVADIKAFMNEATEIRQVGKKDNMVSLKDAETAQNAIADAASVIDAFYKESGMIEKAPWEFVQRGVKLSDKPGTWDSAYTGLTDPKGQPAGILTLLRQIGAEFARMEADTRAQEQTDQRIYEEQMKSSEIEESRRSTEAKMKSQEKKRLLSEIDTMKKSKRHLVEEWEAVVQYLKDLRPACVVGDSTYDERKAARETETEALRQAQNILTNAFNDKTPISLVQQKKGGKFLQIQRHQ